MSKTKIHLLAITPMRILIVYCDRLWQFRVIANYGSVYGLDNAQDPKYYPLRQALIEIRKLRY